MFLVLGFVMILLQIISSVTSADHRALNPLTHHFESYFRADFLAEQTSKSLNGVSNLVAYLNLPKAGTFFGTLSVTLTGGYNWQATHGILKKRFHILYHPPNGLIAQIVEITDSSGPLSSQWKIGDLDANTLRIPIYHLVAAGNILVVQVDGTFLHENYPYNEITISDPVVVNSHTKP